MIDKRIDTTNAKLAKTITELQTVIKLQSKIGNSNGTTASDISNQIVKEFKGGAGT